MEISGRQEPQTPPAMAETSCMMMSNVMTTAQDVFGVCRFYSKKLKNINMLRLLFTCSGTDTVNVAKLQASPEDVRRRRTAFVGDGVKPRFLSRRSSEPCSCVVFKCTRVHQRCVRSRQTCACPRPPPSCPPPTQTGREPSIQSGCWWSHAAGGQSEASSCTHAG